MKVKINTKVRKINMIKNDTYEMNVLKMYSSSKGEERGEGEFD